MSLSQNLLMQIKGNRQNSERMCQLKFSLSYLNKCSDSFATQTESDFSAKVVWLITVQKNDGEGWKRVSIDWKILNLFFKMFAWLPWPTPSVFRDTDLSKQSNSRCANIDRKYNKKWEKKLFYGSGSWKEESADNNFSSTNVIVTRLEQEVTERCPATGSQLTFPDCELKSPRGLQFQGCLLTKILTKFSLGRLVGSQDLV